MTALLRAAVFKGLRDDLAAPTSKPDRAPSLNAHGAGAAACHGRTSFSFCRTPSCPAKRSCRSYWRKVGKRALNYLGGRPLKLVRHTTGTTFYHMGPLPPIPSRVHELHIQKREGGEGVRVWVDERRGPARAGGDGCG